MKRYLLLLAVLPTLASAQQAWNENVITGDPPTTCMSGQPVANCPVTSYRFWRSATTDGGYAAIGTAPTIQFTHTNAAAGRNCYYITAVSTTHGESGPSNTFCKTNTAPPPPAGPPSPPTNGRFVTVAVQAGMDKTPIFRVVAGGLSSVPYGFVPTGRTCGARVATWRKAEWHAVSVRNPTAELWGMTPEEAVRLKAEFAAACRAGA